MSRYGLFCFLGRGHLDPGLAIGRGLRARGHEVTVFHIALAEAAVRHAGLRFVSIDHHEPAAAAAPRVPDPPGRRPWLSTIEAITAHAARTLREAPAALQAARIEAIVADQLDVAAATVAECLDIPCISVSCGPPLYVEDGAPAPYFGWPHVADDAGRARNRRGHAFIARAASPILDLLNATRRQWQLPALTHVNALWSTRGIITQLPRILDFPRVPPPHLFYTSQFRDDAVGARVPFAWERLDGRPLLYASMGTVRNTSVSTFRAIAEACDGLDVQLVLSLGGGFLQAADLGPVPDGTIVVPYAPQRELLSRAVLTINCGGMNTTLDALARGVPMVVLPVAEDQPGIAARIARAGVGIVEPARTLTVPRLRQAVRAVLTDRGYREAARRMQEHLASLDGCAEAVSLIERLVCSVEKECCR
jgi:zeaxanthin glucosyltransferase